MRLIDGKIFINVNVLTERKIMKMESAHIMKSIIKNNMYLIYYVIEKKKYKIHQWGTLIVPITKYYFSCKEMRT